MDHVIPVSEPRLQAQLSLQAVELGIDGGVVSHVGKRGLGVNLAHVDVGVGLGHRLLSHDLGLKLVKLCESRVEGGGVHGLGSSLGSLGHLGAGSEHALASTSLVELDAQGLYLVLELVYAKVCLNR